MPRDTKKTARNRSVTKPPTILTKKVLNALHKFNSDSLSLATNAAFLMIRPYLSDTGFEIQIGGKNYHLSTKAPPEVKHAALFLGIVDSSKPVLKGEKIAELADVAFFIGLSAIPVLHSCGVGKTLSEAISIFIKDQEARQRGGKANLKWTPKVEKLAKDFFKDAKRGRKISNEAAIRYTRAKLQEKGYVIGRTTLYEHL